MFRPDAFMRPLHDPFMDKFWAQVEFNF